ncbi:MULTISPECIES: hypothetical protein [unclassified Frankia]|uniref:hypothetical protein n=1 Tax=unclassified Frankia TaxID=2632575 RepID=UPI002AD5AE70|nr:MULTISPECIES: hypothetical protein [unclassified Frankia]
MPLGFTRLASTVAFAWLKPVDPVSCCCCDGVALGEVDVESLLPHAAANSAVAAATATAPTLVREVVLMNPFPPVAVVGVGGSRADLLDGRVYPGDRRDLSGVTYRP